MPLLMLIAKNECVDDLLERVVPRLISEHADNLLAEDGASLNATLAQFNGLLGRGYDDKRIKQAIKDLTALRGS